MTQHQPKFETVADYIDDCELAIRRGDWPWPPETKTELLAALDEFPEHRHLFLPSASVLRCMGIALDYGREKLLPENFQTRFLRTLATDREFAKAACYLLDRNERR